MVDDDGYDSGLESTLQGISYSPAILAEYVKRDDHKIGYQTASPYVLILEPDGDYFTADFIIDDFLETMHVGFEYDGKLYYSTPDCEFISGPINTNDAIYLPIIKGDFNRFFPEYEMTKRGFSATNMVSVGSLKSHDNLPLICMQMMKEGATGGIFGLQIAYKFGAERLEPYPQEIKFPVVPENPIRSFYHTSRAFTKTKIFLDSINQGDLEGRVFPRIEFNPDFANDNFDDIDDEELEKLTRPTSKSGIDWKEPKSIMDYLNRFVVGQDGAKKSLSIAFSNYMTRKEAADELMPKSNCLLVGPTGVGKTYMVDLLAKEAELPVVKTKVGDKSSTGYVGENLSSVFQYLIGKTKDKDPYAIVFIDEIDKLARSGIGSGNGFGASLQNELIGWLEEAEVGVKKDGHEAGTINTKNILFLGAGAFHGLNGDSIEDIIRKRMNIGQSTLGFGSNPSQAMADKDKDYYDFVEPDDLTKFGLRHELVGRFPVIAPLNYLELEDKIKIINDAENSPLDKYVRLLEFKGFDVDLSPEVPKLIAENAPKGIGARSLGLTVERLFNEISFDINKYADGKVIHVTKELAEELLSNE